MPLVLPQARTRNGVGQTTKDLSEHPWAGADVVLTLLALDEGGNEGRSEPFEMQSAGAPVRQADGARADRAAPRFWRSMPNEAARADRARRAHDGAGEVHDRSRSISACARSTGS